MEAEILLLAVKPQDMRAALAALPGDSQRKLVISIAAGVRLAALSRWLGGHRKLVRCMPNTPALIGAGIAGLYALPEVSAAERRAAEAILGAVGEVVWVEDERLLDPVTAVSGSGPAYVFWFIEQLAASGEKLGLPAETRSKLAMQTVLGAAKLAAQSDEPPRELRKHVTSKGGTTEAALKVFDEEKLAERFMQSAGRGQPPRRRARRRARQGLNARPDRQLPGRHGGRASSCSCCSLRFHFQWLRVPFRNPVGEFVLATTSWMVMPARRVIPGLAGLDLADARCSPGSSQVLGLWIAAAASQRSTRGRSACSRAAIVDLVRYSLYILVGAVIIQAVLSWVNPYTPVAPVFDALTRPFLRPMRRFVPPVGQFDLTPLVLVVLLQVVLILLWHLRPAVASL